MLYAITEAEATVVSASAAELLLVLVGNGISDRTWNTKTVVGSVFFTNHCVKKLCTTFLQLSTKITIILKKSDHNISYKK